PRKKKMPEFIPFHSIPGENGDLRGEGALRYLPVRGSSPGEVMISCGLIISSDAWSFTVIRTLIDYPAKRLSVPVGLTPPRDGDARRCFLAGLGSLPNQVYLTED